MEERVEKILDSDYSRVDIDEMVDGMDIHRDSKRELKKILKKFPTLFGGGLNLRKSFFSQEEVEYLEYQLTKDELKLKRKKSVAIERIKPPSSSKQLKRFIGMINFYRDIWGKRSHILAPLTKLAAETGMSKGSNKKKVPLH